METPSSLLTNDDFSVEPLLDEPLDADLTLEAPKAPVEQPRNLMKLMRKIPVTLTLEVGSAEVSLHDLMSIVKDSVIELDTLAGEPLTIKVNGIAIGRAEVVVSGENYGLKVVEITDVSLDSLAG
ncbi:FliM/FliN family flagellar motor switch protein [Hydrogenophaga aquatica]